ncbi:hypothetical protein EVAR_88294_1 [Eumeta japonica]|uniref:Uncharacterized protein n=1 Tax=Eumeta variegata TaxID=151549 RepID=A0A4C1VPJ3_EUMVA|nr:hypothetical protein EVAR_88294_1 [Eumeta japonica]
MPIADQRGVQRDRLLLLLTFLVRARRRNVKCSPATISCGDLIDVLEIERQKLENRHTGVGATVPGRWTIPDRCVHPRKIEREVGVGQCSFALNRSPPVSSRNWPTHSRVLREEFALRCSKLVDTTDIYGRKSGRNLETNAYNCVVGVEGAVFFGKSESSSRMRSRGRRTEGCEQQAEVSAGCMATVCGRRGDVSRNGPHRSARFIIFCTHAPHTVERITELFSALLSGRGERRSPGSVNDGHHLKGECETDGAFQDRDQGDGAVCRSADAPAGP